MVRPTYCRHPSPSNRTNSSVRGAVREPATAPTITSLVPRTCWRRDSISVHALFAQRSAADGAQSPPYLRCGSYWRAFLGRCPEAGHPASGAP
ncbi:hypothetical protein FRZ03_20250 [Streptomyces misionensis]|uniref:Uncharacterized protein n=1 Tax=Streptomyces misionensis TaxID=67331 RepID=A0A5C6JMJ3_9ACTN|nr:hypothetical protein FRZ03_20250 [Streptomyces misionensis]